MIPFPQTYHRWYRYKGKDDMARKKKKKSAAKKPAKKAKVKTAKKARKLTLEDLSLQIKGVQFALDQLAAKPKTVNVHVSDKHPEGDHGDSGDGLPDPAFQ